MSNLNLSDGIEKTLGNIDEVRLLLLQNGFEGSFMTPSFSSASPYGQNHTPKSLHNLLEKTGKEYGFEIPKVDYWSMFFKLGSQEFDVAYLYSPNFRDYTIAKRPVFEHLGNVVDGMSKLTNMSVIAYSELDRFAIPKIQMYDSGKKVFVSKDAGDEIYSPDYWQKDEEAFVQKAKDNIDAFASMIKEIFDEDNDMNMFSLK